MTKTVEVDQNLCIWLKKNEDSRIFLLTLKLEILYNTAYIRNDALRAKSVGRN